MSQLRIILADLVSELSPKSSEVIQYPGAIWETVKNHFERIIASQRNNTTFPFRSVAVGWWSTTCRGATAKNPGPALTLADSDLIVYFVRDPGDSVIQQMPGAKAPPKSGITGYTGFAKSLTASEVYASGNQYDPVGLGNLAFHELMHFASHLDNAHLHPLKSHNGQPMHLSAETVYATTTLSAGDIAFMAAHLPNKNQKRKPWTGGYSKYIDPAFGRV